MRLRTFKKKATKEKRSTVEKHRREKRREGKERKGKAARGESETEERKRAYDSSRLLTNTGQRRIEPVRNRAKHNV